MYEARRRACRVGVLGTLRASQDAKEEAKEAKSDKPRVHTTETHPDISMIPACSTGTIDLKM